MFNVYRNAMFVMFTSCYQPVSMLSLSITALVHTLLSVVSVYLSSLHYTLHTVNVTYNALHNKLY